MQAAPVTPEVLKWAIGESGLSPHELADRLGVKPTDIADWMKGASRPSKGQLTQLATNLRRPRAMFFLPKAPTELTLPAGLRSAAGRRAADKQALSFDERLYVRRARRLQALLVRLLEDKVVLPHADPSESPVDVGQRLRAWIGITTETTAEWTSPSRALRGWREAVESKGVSVLALPLGTDGLRGFALESVQAPMIAVNTADIPEARCFTIFHELAHLMLTENRTCAADHSPGVEQWCDRVASNALILRGELEELAMKELPGSGNGSQVDHLDLVKRAADRFKVSRRAAAIALEDIGVAKGAYSLVEATWPNVDRTKRRGGRSTAPRTAPKIRLDEYGRLAVGNVLGALDRGAVGESVASEHLRLDRTQLYEARQLLEESST